MIKGISVMGFRLTSPRCLSICIALTFVAGCYLASLPIQAEKKALPNKVNPQIESSRTKKLLAIIVPFRERFEELLEFVPHMHKFLNKQGISFHIFVVQQKDSYRFNRASLINVGFLQTRGQYDYIAMHDVDLLPLNPNLKYAYPENGPLHISSPATHPKYHYDTFVGGILLVTMKHFKQVNGMSNHYWGWGLEDDEFYVRLKDANLKVHRYDNITTGTENTFKHIHDKHYRKRDTRKCYNQREVTRRRDRETGLHDVAYSLRGTHAVTIDKLPVTVFNVELLCDKTSTPWCLCPDPPVVKKAKPP